jgi:hypothetical protein
VVLQLQGVGRRMVQVPSLYLVFVAVHPCVSHLSQHLHVRVNCDTLLVSLLANWSPLPTSAGFLSSSSTLGRDGQEPLRGLFSLGGFLLGDVQQIRMHSVNAETQKQYLKRGISFCQGGISREPSVDHKV